VSGAGRGAGTEPAKFVIPIQRKNCTQPCARRPNYVFYVDSTLRGCAFNLLSYHMTARLRAQPPRVIESDDRPFAVADQGSPQSRKRQNFLSKRRLGEFRRVTTSIYAYAARRRLLLGDPGIRDWSRLLMRPSLTQLIHMRLHFIWRVDLAVD
jgi:hypothetical protein